MQTDFNKFLNILLAIEEAESHLGAITATFDDGAKVGITIEDLKIMAERYHKVVKEAEKAESELSSFKLRLEAVLEDF